MEPGIVYFQSATTDPSPSSALLRRALTWVIVSNKNIFITKYFSREIQVRVLPSSDPQWCSRKKVGVADATVVSLTLGNLDMVLVDFRSTGTNTSPSSVVLRPALT